MSRRSSRRTPKKAALSLPTGVSTGLSSLIDGNESTIASMLSVSISQNNDDTTKTKLMTALTDCMAMNNLSAEALLARFFHVGLLRKYCEDRLNVSSKGNEATLAARIARAWSKPNFEPLPNDGDGAVDAASKSSSKQASDGKKKGDRSKEVNGSTKKRSGEQKQNDNQKGGDEKKESSTKKRKVWASNEPRPSYTVTAPPGQLGFTIKQYSDDFIVTDMSPSCAIQPQGKLRTGDVILAIDGFEITSEDDDILQQSDNSRVITIGGRVISMNAAEHSKGSLLYMKERGMPMFRIMDYSSVGERYGEEFLEELNPPNRGKSGGRLLAGALSSFSAGRK
mmetsp:Transcript_36186/g.73704  ORF Transcript_36186/g.73704 Transcript_36186/m.73704 type:complete len:338 (+) Transcript_36186:2096-3109(+)|eukprot:CAMPEP_0113419400 /NCGR_PEP_ID=MMETSP0013_2-20120614/26757_1 /TAXON_ID=2843 ORGANISM="Skeletonema costatum, Strain 1716" /NCGR_SAMPLE_ID=MMETSP0013_2 /ASSEMBLY_ACC=CAM_ASM_000158 /LENGTH=337 /DNA_ID=CAMNT_0000306775 /DNA_START=77 /DNA_END=1090 /DNA_ORIENTATION=- /assembly_acc=CAM_ASM_000158